MAFGAGLRIAATPSFDLLGVPEDLGAGLGEVITLTMSVGLVVFGTLWRRRLRLNAPTNLNSRGGFISELISSIFEEFNEIDS